MRIFSSVLLLMALTIGYAIPAKAQTCKVSSGKCSGGTVTYIEVYEYDYVEEKPEFPGGGQCLLNFVNQQRKYPEEAYIKGIEGRVMCSFVINADGSVSNITVMKGVEETLNEEAVRILSHMPNWTPGRLKGHTVPVRMFYAVPFRK